MSYFEKKSLRTVSVFGPGRPRPAPENSETLALRPASRRRPHNQHDNSGSSLIMHNLVVDGHRTTVRLEPVIWDALRDIACQQEVTVHNLVSNINRLHIASSLSSAIRAYVVVYLSAALRDTPSAGLSLDQQIGSGVTTGSAFSALRSGK